MGGNADEVKKLVADGADINAQDDFGWTALRYAVRSNHPYAAQALVDLGADVNMPSKSGRTPLMSVAANGLKTMVQGLLDAGADTSMTDKEGLTAYDHAREDLKDLVKPKPPAPADESPRLRMRSLCRRARSLRRACAGCPTEDVVSCLLCDLQRPVV